MVIKEPHGVCEFIDFNPGDRLPWFTLFLLLLAHAFAYCNYANGCNISERHIFFFCIPLMFPLVKLTIKLSPAPASVQRCNQCNNYVLVSGPCQHYHYGKKNESVVIKSDRQIKTNNIVANNVVLSLFLSPSFFLFFPWTLLCIYER